MRGEFEKFKSKKRCNKDRFENEFDCKKRANQLGMRAYPCPHCNGWHLTSRVFDKGRLR